MADYILGGFFLIGLLLIGCGVFIVYGFTGRGRLRSQARRFGMTLTLCAICAVFLSSGVIIPAANATISNAPTAIVSAYSCEKGPGYIITVDNGATPNYYALAASGTPTVPCGTLVYGGPSNAGGALGTNGITVLNTLLQSSACVGGHITVPGIGCTLYFENGDYQLGGTLDIRENNTVLMGASEYGTQLDFSGSASTVYIESLGEEGLQILTLTMRGNPSVTTAQGIRLDGGTNFWTVQNVQTLNTAFPLIAVSSSNSLEVDYGYVSNDLFSGINTSIGECIDLTTAASAGVINGDSFYGVHCAGFQYGVAMTGGGQVANDQFYSLSLESESIGISINDANAYDDTFYPHYDQGSVTTPEQILSSGISTICESDNFYLIGSSTDTSGNIIRTCYTAIGKISNFLTGGTSSVTKHFIGIYGNSTTEIASQTYTFNFPVCVTSADSSNANNAILIKDSSGNSLLGGAVHTLTAQRIPVGFTITWGGFTGTAGTVTVFGCG